VNKREKMELAEEVFLELLGRTNDIENSIQSAAKESEVEYSDLKIRLQNNFQRLFTKSAQESIILNFKIKESENSQREFWDKLTKRQINEENIYYEFQKVYNRMPNESEKIRLDISHMIGFKIGEVR
jgi:hypothetical protein